MRKAKGGKEKNKESFTFLNLGDGRLSHGEGSWQAGGTYLFGILVFFLRP